MQFDIVYELGSYGAQGVLPIDNSPIIENFKIHDQNVISEFNTLNSLDLGMQDIKANKDESYLKNSFSKILKKTLPELTPTSLIYVPYDDPAIQRVEVEGHKLTRKEIDYERWLWAFGFSDFVEDPRNDYQPDPTEGAVYYNNSCTNASHTSPSPASLPKGMDVSKLNELRNLVNAAADEIKAMSNQSVEYGIVFYLTSSGKITRDPMISGTADSLDIPYYHGPLQKMIAFIHSHPTKPGEVKDAWRPSTPGNSIGSKDDQTIMNEWITQGYADSNSLAYILDGSGKNGNGSGDVYEYTMAGTLTPRPKGANISKDCVK